MQFSPSPKSYLYVSTTIILSRLSVCLWIKKTRSDFIVSNSYLVHIHNRRSHTVADPIRPKSDHFFANFFVGSQSLMFRLPGMRSRRGRRPPLLTRVLSCVQRTLISMANFSFLICNAIECVCGHLFLYHYDVMGGGGGGGG